MSTYHGEPSSSLHAVRHSDDRDRGSEFRDPESRASGGGECDDGFWLGDLRDLWGEWNEGFEGNVTVRGIKGVRGEWCFGG